MQGDVTLAEVPSGSSGRPAVRDSKEAERDGRPGRTRSPGETAAEAAVRAARSERRRRVHCGQSVYQSEPGYLDKSMIQKQRNRSICLTYHLIYTTQGRGYRRKKITRRPTIRPIKRAPIPQTAPAHAQNARTGTNYTQLKKTLRKTHTHGGQPPTTNYQARANHTNCARPRAKTRAQEQTTRNRSGRLAMTNRAQLCRQTHQPAARSPPQHTPPMRKQGSHAYLAQSHAYGRQRQSPTRKYLL